MTARTSRPPSGALMMYAASEHDSNLYYAVKFSVPDPFPYFRIGNKNIILMSDLELGRAQKQANQPECFEAPEDTQEDE